MESRIGFVFPKKRYFHFSYKRLTFLQVFTRVEWYKKWHITQKIFIKFALGQRSRLSL